jgi:hypothetical protein
MNLLEFIDRLPPEDRQFVIDHFVQTMIKNEPKQVVVTRKTAKISTLGTEEEIINDISQALNIPVEEIRKQNIAEKLRNITANYNKTSSLTEHYRKFLTSHKAPSDKFEELQDVGKFLISANLKCTLEIPETIRAVPDFIIRTENKKIGIEHTRLMNSDSQVLIKTAIHILKRAEKMLLQRNPTLKEIVNVSINYWKPVIGIKNLSNKLSNQEKDNIAKNIADYIEGFLKKQEISKPEFIDYISSSNRTEHPLIIILNENYIAKPELEKLFADSIHNKEGKLGSYLQNNSLDALWLLIIISGVTASSSYELKYLNQINSQFDKIFLFDNFSCEYLLVHQSNDKKKPS